MMGALVAGMQALLLSGVHLALMVLMAPLCAGFTLWCHRAMAGERASLAVVSRWGLILRIWRQPGMRAAAGARVTAFVPWMTLTMVVSAVALVPSYSLGMVDEGASDFLVIAGLLFGAQVASCSVGLASGQGQEGRQAAIAMTGTVLLAPALVMAVAVVAMAVPGGTLGGMVRFMRLMDDSAGVRGPLALVGGAFVLIGVDRVAAGMDRAFAMMTDNLAGPDRAVMVFTRDLLALAWITLAGDLLWPDAIVIPDGVGSGGLLAHMLLAIVLWAMRTMGLCVVVACLRTFVMASGQVARLRAGLALLCACLAIVLLFAGREFG
ncbi:hypothetical protein [Novacetimonas pomaceti]|nr:hypothetical protein [Novacetimonas pomaceti]